MRYRLLTLAGLLIGASACTKANLPSSALSSGSSASNVVTRQNVVNITANATDNVGVTKVEFYVNNVLTCTVKAAPYVCPWPVPNVPNATYNLVTKAYDAAGNVGTSATVTVTSD